MKRFFVKGSETVKLAKSGDTVNGTSEGVFNYIKEHNDDVFEAIVSLAGTNDIKSKSASNSMNSIAQELFKTAKDLLSKDNVKRVFICKIPPKLDNQMRDVKVTEINEKVVESMHDINIENLFLIESVSKEIQNFNKGGLHLSKTGLTRLSAVMLKSLYGKINSS